MPNIYNIATGEYLESADIVVTCGYPADGESAFPPRYGDWLISPVLPDCDRRYWVVADDGESLRVMTEEERAALDAAENPPASSKEALLAQLRAELERIQALPG